MNNICVTPPCQSFYLIRYQHHHSVGCGSCHEPLLFEQLAGSLWSQAVVQMGPSTGWLPFARWSTEGFCGWSLLWMRSCACQEWSRALAWFPLGLLAGHLRYSTGTLHGISTLSEDLILPPWPPSPPRQGPISSVHLSRLRYFNVYFLSGLYFAYNPYSAHLRDFLFQMQKPNLEFFFFLKILKAPGGVAVLLSTRQTFGRCGEERKPQRWRWIFYEFFFTTHVRPSGVCWSSKFAGAWAIGSSWPPSLVFRNPIHFAF